MKANSISTLIFSFVVAVCTSCTEEKTPQVKNTSSGEYFKSIGTGVADGGSRKILIDTPKGKFSVWVKRFGNNPRIKVLLLHGGPGATHEYFECFENFFPQEGIEFIYYDQLGSAYSDQPGDTSLWVTERFVEEVEQVRKALGVTKDNFYLLGHSWGGILATEYALKYQDNLKALIISNMMSSCPDYNAYASNVLAKQMSPSVLDSVKMFEEKKDYANPKYMQLLIPHFYKHHICRLDEWPDPVVRAFDKLNKQVYITMQGPSEFGLSGKLERWDRKPDLKNIRVPALIIGGKYDTMDPQHMEWMSQQVQQGSYLYCPEGSHMSMYDDQQTYMKGLIKFIKEIDEGKKTVNMN